jgi:hypothetical protein
MGWWVLSKYYQETDKNPIYVTALLLHPEKRRRYMDRNWQEDWREPALNAARAYWAEYKDRPIISTGCVDEEGKQDRPPTEYEKLEQEMSVLDCVEDEDEFEKFINASPKRISTKSPLEWWTREEQRLEYPRLYQMAIDVLSVPPMSDAPERVFSGARRLISWDRARLSVENVEKLECLNNWVQNNHVQQLYVEFDGERIEISGDEGSIE